MVIGNPGIITPPSSNSKDSYHSPTRVDLPPHTPQKQRIKATLKSCKHAFVQLQDLGFVHGQLLAKQRTESKVLSSTPKPMLIRTTNSLVGLTCILGYTRVL